MTTILCIDDDAYLTDLLSYAVRRAGYVLHVAASGAAALPLVQASGVDLIVLDLDLPDTAGLTLLPQLRAVSAVPILVLTGNAQEEQLVRSFALGADDYVTKPFSMEVLLARLQNLLRRADREAAGGIRRPTSTVLALDGCLFDTTLHELVAGAVRVRLTPMESAILCLLCTHAGQLHSAERILEQVGGYETESDTKVIKTHIRHLRAKMEDLPTQPDVIRTVPGRGYMVERVLLMPPPLD